MAAEPSPAGGMQASTGNSFLISFGLMLVAEISLILGLFVFHGRGASAPLLEQLVWIWPLCWITVIIFCMTLASWGRLLSKPTSGLPGKRAIAAVMVFRLFISAGLVIVPLSAVIYGLVMLALALASAAATPTS